MSAEGINTRANDAPASRELQPTIRRSHSRGRRGHGTTALSGGKVKHGHHVPGMKDDGWKDDKRNYSGGLKKVPKRRLEHDAPFDDKGRCHYHKNVQLAATKMTGG